MLAEKIFFFPGSGNRNLLGFLHYADQLSNLTGIVYCHPFAEEKNMSHSVVVKTARMLALSGFPVLRFDLSGCGDSEGDLRTSSIEDWQQDLDKAIEFFRKETGVSQTLLWGLRSGAGLVLMREKNRKDINGLLLWQPVLDFSLHIKQFLRRAISSQISNGKAVDTEINAENDLKRHGISYVIGYPITKDLYDGFNSLGSQPADIVPSVPVHILSISLMDRPALSLKNYAEHLKVAGTPAMIEHITASPFWDRYWQWECKRSTEAALRWIQRTI